MLKSDLVNVLVTKRGVTQKQAEATIETIFEAMKEALVRGENIEIRGLGVLNIKELFGVTSVRERKRIDVVDLSQGLVDRRYRPSDVLAPPVRPSVQRSRGSDSACCSGCVE